MKTFLLLLMTAFVSTTAIGQSDYCTPTVTVISNFETRLGCPGARCATTHFQTEYTAPGGTDSKDPSDQPRLLGGGSSFTASCSSNTSVPVSCSAQEANQSSPFQYQYAFAENEALETVVDCNNGTSVVQTSCHIFNAYTSTAVISGCVPPPSDPPPGGGGDGVGGCDPNDFVGGDQGAAGNCSPIIIDLSGRGLRLTSAAEGVKFDITGTGHPIQVAWTADAENGFLVLDRNGNGVIDSGKELFGNFTPQFPAANTPPNGFLALAVFDKPEFGGNGDGIIDAKDQIFPILRIWTDDNHDGISQPGELHTLSSLGIQSISLDYQLSQKKDQFGNVFRYRAKIVATNPNSTAAPSTERFAYDVLLTAQP